MVKALPWCVSLSDHAGPHEVWNNILRAIAQHPVAAVLGKDRVARWSGLHSLWQIYRGVPADTSDFAASLLSGLEITWEITGGKSADIPARGPLVVVANHPTGGAEGLIAMSLLNRRRGDMRVFSNRLLDHVPELALRQFNVGDAGDARRAMVAAVRHLQAGGAVLMFPAGTVAHWQRRRGYAEAPWHPSAARLALLTGAAVQPLAFRGRTTWRWKLLSAVSRHARTGLLPRELLAQRGQTIRVDIGTKMLLPAEIETYFRDRT